MALDNITYLARNFYYNNPSLTIGIIVGLTVFFLLKPEAAIKTIAVVLLFCLVIYSFAFLGKSASTGMLSKKQMINQTVGRNK